MAASFKKRLTRMELVEMSLALEPHLPGSSHFKSNQNYYDIPEGAPLVDPTYLIDVYSGSYSGSYSNAQIRMESSVRSLETQKRYLSAAAEAESELVRRDKLNRGKSSLDILYKECLKKGIDPANP